MAKRSEELEKRVLVRMISATRETVADYNVLTDVAGLLRKCAEAIQSEGLCSEGFRRFRRKLRDCLGDIGAKPTFVRNVNSIFEEEGGVLTIGGRQYQLSKKASDETADAVASAVAVAGLGSSAETTAMV